MQGNVCVVLGIWTADMPLSLDLLVARFGCVAVLGFACSFWSGVWWCVECATAFHTVAVWCCFCTIIISVGNALWIFVASHSHYFYVCMRVRFVEVCVVCLRPDGVCVWGCKVCWCCMFVWVFECVVVPWHVCIFISVTFICSVSLDLFVETCSFFHLASLCFPLRGQRQEIP